MSGSDHINESVEAQGHMYSYDADDEELRDNLPPVLPAVYYVYGSPGKGKTTFVQTIINGDPNVNVIN